MKIGYTCNLLSLIAVRERLPGSILNLSTCSGMGGDTSNCLVGVGTIINLGKLNTFPACVVLLLLLDNDWCIESIEKSCANDGERSENNFQFRDCKHHYNMFLSALAWPFFSKLIDISAECSAC